MSAAAVAIDTDIAGIWVAFVACIAESIADVDERLAGRGRKICLSEVLKMNHCLKNYLQQN